MKKSILFLFGLGVLLTSCETEGDKPVVDPVTPAPVDNAKFGVNPTNQAELDEIAGLFKYAKAGEISKIKDKLEPNSVADLEKWDAEYAQIKDLTTEAAEGVAGFMQRGSKKMPLNAKGVETAQLIAKGLIGAFQLNGFNKAAMEGIMKATDAKGRREALNKAVTYLLGGLDFSKTGDDYKAMNNSFGKYMVKYPEMKKGIEDAAKSAFANANDKAKYSAAMVELNKWATRVVAFRAVHYLAGYGGKIKEQGGWTADNVHELSEGLGFAYSLAFAYNYAKHTPYFTIDEAREFTDVDLYTERKDTSGQSKLDLSSEKIAKMFGFKVADAL